MASQKEDLEAGRRHLQQWAEQRFPDARIVNLGKKIDRQYYRWTIDFGHGQAGLRLAATERCLENEPVLGS